MKTIYVLAALFALSSAQAATTQYTIEAGGRVEFRSEAPLEEIVGRTTAVSGFLIIDPAAGSDAQAEVRVDLKKLNTGIELRDEHMRNNHLETDRYPEAVFTLSSFMVPAGSLIDGVRTAVTTSGQLELHGVKAEIQPETYLTWNSAANSIRIEANFTVTLQQFNIVRPQFLVMKLAEEQRIMVDITARAQTSSAQR